MRFKLTEIYDRRNYKENKNCKLILRKWNKIIIIYDDNGILQRKRLFTSSVDIA